MFDRLSLKSRIISAIGILHHNPSTSISKHSIFRNVWDIFIHKVAVLRVSMHIYSQSKEAYWSTSMILCPKYTLEMDIQENFCVCMKYPSVPNLQCPSFKQIHMSQSTTPILHWVRCTYMTCNYPKSRMWWLC